MKTRNATIKKDFTFAGFDFPKHVWTLPPRSLAKRKERYNNACTSDYYHAPRPNVCTGTSFYLGESVTPRWKYCDEISQRIRHTGWFCDSFQDGKIRGLVFRLPRSRGFLIGWTMGEGMASAIETDSIYDDELEAAHAADSLAENVAEKEREFQEEQETELEEVEA